VRGRPNRVESAGKHPSLDVIRDEFDIRQGEQDQRSSAFDSRAQLVLAFGGVLVGLSSPPQNVVLLLGQVVAFVAAALAGTALWPRVAGALSPRMVRDRYLNHEPEATKLALLDTRIWLFEQNDHRLELKLSRLRLSVYFLTLAVLPMLVGSSLNLFVREGVQFDRAIHHRAHNAARASAETGSRNHGQRGGQHEGPCEGSRISPPIPSVVGCPAR
jgi:hypothetical protein